MTAGATNRSIGSSSTRAPSRADVIGSVDVGSGVRAKRDVQHVVALDGEGGGRSEGRNRITRKHLGVRIDRYRQIDDRAWIRHTAPTGIPGTGSDNRPVITVVVPAALALATWIYLALGHGRFWSTAVRLPTT